LVAVAAVSVPSTRSSATVVIDLRVKATPGSASSTVLLERSNCSPSMVSFALVADCVMARPRA